MKKMRALIVVCLVIMCVGSVQAQVPEQKAEQNVWYAAENFSAAVWFTTDYVFRGISQTDENPAVQGTLNYNHPLGFYFGVWGSNVDITPGNSVEIDSYVGYTNSIYGINYDLSFLYYWYPGADGDPKPTYLELHVGLSYPLTVDWPVVPTFSVGYFYSPDYLFEDGDGHYVNAKIDLALPMKFGIAVEGGYQHVQGDALTGGDMGEGGDSGYDYFHYRAGVYKEIFGFNLDLSFHNTADIDSDFFGEGLADERVVFTISREF
jgi:uncharacterized protein (TIGR02001 family)